MKTTQINLRTLKAVNLAASAEETRYYLKGVFVECRETTVTYVATDGHRMLVAQEDLPERGEGEERLLGDFIIPSDVCKAIKVNKHAETLSGLIALGNGRFELDARVFKPIDGTYPDWRRVCPAAQKKPAEGETIAQFNPLYVAMFGKFAEAMGWKALVTEIHYTTANAPHAITFGQGKVFGVLMPVRGRDDVWTGAPEWTTQAPPSPALMAAE